MTPAKMNKVESAMRMALAFRNAFNMQEVEKMMSLFRGDCVIETYHPAPDGITIIGKEALCQYWQDVFNKYPDIHMDIEEIFGFGERCIIRWKLHWTGSEGEKEHLRGIDVFKTSNDLICEKYAYGKSG